MIISVASRSISRSLLFRSPKLPSQATTPLFALRDRGVLQGHHRAQLRRQADTKQARSIFFMAFPKSKALAGPGLFYVLSEPKESLPIEEFHDWYNSEHGPARIRLPFIPSGYRHKAADGAKPSWLASYEVDDLAEFTKPGYMELMKNKSLKESEIIQSGLETLDRRFYSFVASRGSYTGPPPVLVGIQMVIKESDLDEANKWYDEV